MSGDARDKSELAWYAGVVRDALIHPRNFAATVHAEERFGIAAVITALACGLCLSLAVDATVVASKRADPLSELPRLATDSVLFAVRFAVITALAALLTLGLARLRRLPADLARSFTAIAFALAALPFALLVPGVLAAAPPPFAAAAAIVGVFAAVALWAFAMTALNLVALSGRVAGVTLAVAAALLFGLLLQDQLARIGYTALSYVPQMVPPVSEHAVAGTERRVGNDVVVRLPEAWRESTATEAGETARFERTDARLTVRVREVSAFTTVDELAHALADQNVGDLARAPHSRRLVRIDGALGVDDGWLDGDVAAVRQFVLLRGTKGYGFEFRYFQPRDGRASLQEAADIAAAIRVLP